MKKLDRKEAIELGRLIDDIQVADDRTMYKGQGRHAYRMLIDELYDNGFKIIKE